MNIITENLFDEILIKPAVECDKLLIATGYASATMAHRHLGALKDASYKTDIELCIGMGVGEGVDKQQHEAFVRIANTNNNNFLCNYLVDLPPMHSKLYIWLKKEEPVIAFIGSANYTQNAFSQNQREAMSVCDPKSSFLYFKMLQPYVKNCISPNIQDYISIFIKNTNIQNAEENSTSVDALSQLEHIKISHLTSDGRLPLYSSRLNWGHRQNGLKRDLNQAYLQLPPDVYRSNFFPPKPIHFTVLTDDDKILICVRAQKDEIGQCIHTSLNNAELGVYFRNRLGLAEGAQVTKEDLIKYGRTDIDFYKIDEETFFMDFSV